MKGVNLGENSMPRKPKGSSARFVMEGESGPKIKPKSVADKQQVNILVLSFVGLEGWRLG